MSFPKHTVAMLVLFTVGHVEVRGRAWDKIQLKCASCFRVPKREHMIDLACIPFPLATWRILVQWDMLEHPLLFSETFFSVRSCSARHSSESALVQWDMLEHPLLFSETCLSFRSCSVRHSSASALVQWDILQRPLFFSETFLSIRSCSVRHAWAYAFDNQIPVFGIHVTCLLNQCQKWQKK
jgi:hypothetical protein